MCNEGVVLHDDKGCGAFALGVSIFDAWPCHLFRRVVAVDFANARSGIANGEHACGGKIVFKSSAKGTSEDE